MLLIILALLSPIVPPNQPPLDDIACIVGGEASHWDAQVFIATQLIHDHERGVTCATAGMAGVAGLSRPSAR
jgi:hypothetical protein